MNSHHLLTWALHIAERGWPVFPLRPNSKVPALHSVARCPGTGACANGHAGWEQRATTDPAVVKRCWSHDAYNIGLATGPAATVVLDLDVAKPDEAPPEGWNMLGISSGSEALAWIALQAGHSTPETYTVATPTGGRHLYFRAPKGVELRNTQGVHGLGWLVDTRGHGGYVTAPGSRLPHGSYQLLDDRDPMDLPGWLVQRLTPKPRERLSRPHEIGSANRHGYLRSALDREAKRVTGAVPGARNKSLFIAACALGQLVAGGALSADEVWAVLEHASDLHVNAGAYGERQRQNTISSGLTAGASRPRTLDEGDPAA